jgi:hypothetical protein
MRVSALLTCEACGLVALAAALAAPAQAMPTPLGSAQDVVRSLQANGFQVIVSPAGTTTPLDRCAVTAIRPGPKTAEDNPGTQEDALQKASHTTVYVDVKC